MSMRLRKRTRELGIIRTRISQILMITGLSVGLAWQASAFAASPEASSYLGLEAKIAVAKIPIQCMAFRPPMEAMSWWVSLPMRLGPPMALS